MEAVLGHCEILGVTAIDGLQKLEFSGHSNQNFEQVIVHLNFEIPLL